jgi:catechol 2,3-dioxygenase-like lactoylglutathione lyase family enzyme
MQEIRALVPMAHVADVARSIAFYQKLGFEVDNTFVPEGDQELSWAYLVCERAQLMLARATAPVLAGEQAVLYYVYCQDVDAMRASLVEQGISAGPITYPFYAPRGEFRIEDPDGYVLMVTHT